MSRGAVVEKGVNHQPEIPSVCPTLYSKERLMKTKTPKCKFCGDPHYAMSCPRKPRKAMKTRKPLRASRITLRARTPLRSSSTSKPLKRGRMKAKSSSQRSLLVAKLDRVFSIYIRLKDADGDIARCVTCPFAAHWRGMQNGHYKSRRYMIVRWDEMNCHVQCPNCNETLGGNLIVYREFMVATYGEEAVVELERLAQSGEKVPTGELQNLIDYYTREVAKLQK